MSPSLRGTSTGDGGTLLVVDRTDHPTHTPEAEPLLVAQEGETVLLVLNDGIELRADRAELLAAVGERAA